MPISIDRYVPILSEGSSEEVASGALEPVAFLLGPQYLGSAAALPVVAVGVDGPHAWLTGLDAEASTAQFLLGTAKALGSGPGSLPSVILEVP